MSEEMMLWEGPKRVWANRQQRMEALEAVLKAARCVEVFGPVGRRGALNDVLMSAIRDYDELLEAQQ